MWVFFEYVTASGRVPFSEWRSSLPKASQARLDDKMRAIGLYGTNVSTKLLTGPLEGFPHLRKIRVEGELALRPILCLGPTQKDQEFTILMPAIEKDGKWVPANARERAEERRLEVTADPTRRTAYEVPE